MTDFRQQKAKEIRLLASEMAYNRNHPVHRSNGDEQRFACANYAMSFSKGLEHDSGNGLVKEPEDFKAFRTAIDNGYVEPFTTSVPTDQNKQRQWEAPTAGHVYDLQGPDSYAVTMSPPPALGTKELAYEMAEVYELAILRDVRLTDFTSSSSNPKLAASISRLENIGYDLTGTEGHSRKNEGGVLTTQTLFRGSSPGVESGPYLSQFLLIGNKGVANNDEVTAGIIQYGALGVDQRVPVAISGKNFMTTWDDWLYVQNGADPGNGDYSEIYGPPTNVTKRFISTPRDLATYVHFDALYEAYLNACLILLGMKAPTDPGFYKLAGNGSLHLNSFSLASDTITRAYEIHKLEAGGFALWGGPHILTLVTEVATRALKAVRYQKFNIHCRLRPEALAGRIEKAGKIESDFPVIGNVFTKLEGTIAETVGEIQAFNSSGTKLLPMAYQEGSPMHPSYGAGHATVAGACVTILKAFFDTSTVLLNRDGKILFAHAKPGDSPVAFVPDNTMDKLEDVNDGSYLTLEGELNKLAANIAIARNMAGVHYYSDYYDSLRMGEEIAIGILEEQALCYTKDSFVVSIPTFDGHIRTIGR